MTSFFVTCGRGMDYFVVKELHNIPGVTSVDPCDGKVFFNYKCIEESFSIEPLIQIKSAERIFLNVFKGPKPFRNTIDVLFESLEKWNEVIAKWKQLKYNQKIYSSICEEPSTKKFKTDSEPLCSVSFRLNCKCTGATSRFRNSPSFLHKLSQKIQNKLKWETNLRNAELEIYIHWNDDCMLIGFPLTKTPLSKRIYLESISLRTTVCWAMTYSAKIKPGYIVCDPMCGAGTILIELLKCWPVNFVYGFDNNPEQLDMARKCCNFANVEKNVQLLQCSVDALPLKNESIDAVLCDFPFGLQHGTIDYARDLLPKALKEIDRICKSDSRIVMLISQQLCMYLLEQIQTLFPRSIPVIDNERSSRANASWWKSESKISIKLGALPAVITSFQKRNLKIV